MSSEKRTGKIGINDSALAGPTGADNEAPMGKVSIPKDDLIIYLLQANLVATTNLLNYHLTPHENTDQARKARTDMKMNGATTAMFINALIDREIGSAASRGADINLDDMYDKLSIGLKDDADNVPSDAAH